MEYYLFKSMQAGDVKIVFVIGGIIGAGNFIR